MLLGGLVAPGVHTDFLGGGGENDARRATPPRGLWEYAPPENVSNLHALRLLLGLQKGWKLN